MMRKFLSLLFLSIFFNTSAIGVTVNCVGGECKFNNSYHYKYVKTHCLENLNFEEVDTDFLYFTILKTGKKCTVTEIIEEK